MSGESEKDPDGPMLPISPSTGMDPEIRQFIGRVMTGYEAAHRTIRDMSEMHARSARDTNEALSKMIRMQMQVAEERERLVSQNHKRDLEAKEAAQKAEAFGQLTGDVRSILMLAGKKYLGVPLTGNDTHGMQDFLKTLSNDQVTQLLSEGTIQLSVAQRQLLGSTIMSLAESESPKTEPALEPPKAAE